MNARNLPASVLLVLLGAGATLLIGAFARFDTASSLNPTASSPSLTASRTSASLVPNDPAPAAASVPPPAGTNFSPGLAEIVKLAQAHVDESLVLAYIKSSHQVFAPTAEEILYLSDLGLSQDVIGALVGPAPPMAAPPQLAAVPAIAVMPEPMPPVPPAPPASSAPALASAAPPMAVAPSDANEDPGMFYNELAPYGTWEQQPDYGMVWQPTVVTINPDWSPYVDGGQWLNSDSGWYWQSDYSWGWAAFHYGRWANVRGRGWIWQPGDNWAPAWVAWRSSSSYVGWAPLPPGAGINVLAQLTYHSQPVGLNSAFGLPASAYTFVNLGNLTSRNLPRRVVPATRANALVLSSVLLNTYAIVNNRIFNGGISPESVAAARNRPVPQVSLRAVNSRDSAGLALDRKTLAVYVPPAASSETAAEPSVAASARAQARENPPHQDSTMLAENDAAETPASPVPPNAGEAPVQLPPLRYPSSPAPQFVLRHGRAVNMGPTSVASPSRPPWRGQFPAVAMERPSSPAPAAAFERGFNQPPRQRPESPPVAVEYHPPPAEAARPPTPVRAPEPVRTAPAPAPSPSSSKSSR